MSRVARVLKAAPPGLIGAIAVIAAVVVIISVLFAIWMIAGMIAEGTARWLVSVGLLAIWIVGSL